MRTFALLVLAASALFVVAGSVALFGAVIGDPLDRTDAAIVEMVGIVAAFFLAIAFRAWFVARRRHPGAPMTGIVAFVPTLAGIGAVSGVLVAAFLIWAYLRVDARRASALCDELGVPAGAVRHGECIAAAKPCWRGAAPEGARQHDAAAACLRAALGLR